MYNSTRGDMNFDAVKIDATTVCATGNDENGDFEINGSLNKTRVKFIKQYIGKHKLIYEGSINPDRSSMKGFYRFEEN